MRKKLNQVLLDLEARHDHSDEKRPENALLAVDYGEKFTGLAFAPDGTTVLPLKVVKTSEALTEIGQKIKEHYLKKIVLGLPIGIHGEENHICQQIRGFGRQLEKKYKLPVEYVNERYSSQKTLIKSSNQRLDDLAAMNILEYYLSHKS